MAGNAGCPDDPAGGEGWHADEPLERAEAFQAASQVAEVVGMRRGLRARGEARAVWLRLPAHVWDILASACKEGRTSLGGLIAGLILHALGELEDEAQEDLEEEPPAPRRQDPRLSPEEEALELARLREEVFWARVAQEPAHGVRLTRDHKGRLRPAPEVERLG